MFKWLLGLTLLLCTSVSFAQIEHQLVRRVTVFPVLAGKPFSKAADEAWWKVREALTNNRRFMVASKNFLIKKDVYQPRGKLTPADAIILGQLLDANALVVTYLEERILHMKVYEGDLGRVLWEHSLALHPSLPVSQQLVGLSKKLINDFIAAIPYQGFVVVDSYMGRPVYSESSRNFFKVDVGDNAKIDVGDKVHVVRVYTEKLVPIFGGEAMVEVFAEGRVFSRERNVVTVEVLRATDLSRVVEKSLVKFPREFKRLRESLSIRDSLKRKVNPSYFSPEMKDYDVEEEETKPLIAAITFITNLAIFLLLAF